MKKKLWIGLIIALLLEVSCFLLLYEPLITKYNESIKNCHKGVSELDSTDIYCLGDGFGKIAYLQVAFQFAIIVTVIVFAIVYNVKNKKNKQDDNE